MSERQALRQLFDVVANTICDSGCVLGTGLHQRDLHGSCRIQVDPCCERIVGRKGQEVRPQPQE